MRFSFRGKGLYNNPGSEQQFLSDGPSFMLDLKVNLRVKLWGFIWLINIPFAAKCLLLFTGKVEIILAWIIYTTRNNCYQLYVSGMTESLFQR